MLWSIADSERLVISLEKRSTKLSWQIVCRLLYDWNLLKTLGLVGWCYICGMSEIPPDKTASHGDHLLLWILISPHAWHNTVCATEESAWARQASLPYSFKLVQRHCDIFHKVLVPLIKTKRSEQLSHYLSITISQHLLLLTSRKLAHILRITNYSFIIQLILSSTTTCCRVSSPLEQLGVKCLTQRYKRYFIVILDFKARF